MYSLDVNCFVVPWIYQDILLALTAIDGILTHIASKHRNIVEPGMLGVAVRTHPADLEFSIETDDLVGVYRLDRLGSRHTLNIASGCIQVNGLLYFQYE
mgnify:FL=1